MPSFKDPSFQDRVGAAAQAKQKALDKLKAKPPVDPQLLADRQAARERREAAEAEKRAAKKEAAEAAKLAKAAEAAAREAAKPKPLSDEEKKAARDARYAARKNRKG